MPLRAVLGCVLLAALVAVAAAAPADDKTTCYSAGEPNAVLQACERLITSGQARGYELAVAYLWRGDAYDRMKEHDRAIAELTESIRLDPKIANAYYIRGAAYRAKGDNDRAIADFTAVIRLDPKHALAYDYRGGAYESTGDDDKALADFRMAVQLDPNLQRAKDGVARLEQRARSAPR